MIKDELLFDWRVAESHPGYKFFAVLLVGLVFAGIFALVNVKIDTVRSPVIETASVLYFTDDELGRSWRTVAEEAGPFPGRLESGAIETLDDLKSFGGNRQDRLGEYEVSFRPYVKEISAGGDLFVQKGKQFFPNRFEVESSGNALVANPGVVRRTPILVPYDSGAVAWMPTDLPDFEVDFKEEFLSASWRFVLKLRADGTVDQCVALSGSGGQGAQTMCGWLSGVRFKPGADERWMGLRVEFVNK